MSGIIWLDDYDRKARLAPGLLALLPLPVLITAFGLRQNPVLAVLASLLIAAGGPLALAKYVRSRGLGLEKSLYTNWGGPPTTLLLSNEDAAGDALREQRRANVERVSNRLLPASVPPHTDAVLIEFDAAVTAVRQRTYNHDNFPMVFTEVKNYGYERNALAVRLEASTLNILGAIICLSGLVLSATHHLHANRSALLVAFVVLLISSTWWLFWPTKARVRQAADIYARQLLDAAATL